MLVYLVIIIVSFVFGYLGAALLRVIGTQDLIQKLIITERKYCELLNQIKMKYPNLNRHETALHYLKAYQKLFKKVRKIGPGVARGNNGKNIDDQKS